MRDAIRSLTAALLFLASGAIAGCAPDDDAETISASVRSGGTFQRDLAFGDEDGAVIIEQARHYSISEIRQDASTQWAARYIYQPAPGFIGDDRVALDVRTGASSALEPGRVRRVTIRISVRE